MPSNAELQTQISQLQRSINNLLTKEDLNNLASKEDIRKLQDKISENTRKLDERMKAIEDTMAECKVDISSNSKLIANQKEKVDDTERKVAEKLEELRLKDLQRDIYDRRLNLLIFGVKEKEGVFGETSAESLLNVKQLLSDMEVENHDNIKIIDCHRLPQKKRSGDDVKPRPIIFKVEDMFDLRRITDKRNGLKEISKTTKQRLGLGKHLPKSVVSQKQLLQKKYDEFFSRQLKPKWHFNYATLKFSIQDVEGNTLAE